MGEIGIDLSSRRPKRLTVEMQLHADWAITLACGAHCPYVPTTVEDWDIPDPAGRPIEEVRRSGTPSSCASRTCSTSASRRSASTAPPTRSGWRVCCLI